jgi:hypothetical protein
MTRVRLSAALLALSLLLPGGGAHAEERQSERQAKARAMFAELCKTAGFKIHKIVKGVDGIYLLKLRPPTPNFGDQYRMDDPYTGGDVFIDNLLMGRNEKGSVVMDGYFSKGYSYVEAEDPKDSKRYRYTGRIEEPWQTNKSYLKGYKRFVMDKAPATGLPPHYGVTYDDISTHEERDYWIAGSSLKVIDLKTNEIIAERIGYMIDQAQGSRAGARQPWLMAKFNACPSFPKDPGGHPFSMRQVRDFVEQVLIPTAN